MSAQLRLPDRSSNFFPSSKESDKNESIIGSKPLTSKLSLIVSRKIKEARKLDTTDVISKERAVKVDRTVIHKLGRYLQTRSDWEKSENVIHSG